MDILDRVLARKEPVKLVQRKAYTVRVNGRDLAGRIVSRPKAAKLSRRLRKAGYAAEPCLFGMVTLTPAELARFG
jgi:hypothetical protein